MHAVLILNNPSADVAAIMRETGGDRSRINDSRLDDLAHDEFPRTASTMKLQRREIARLLHSRTVKPATDELPELSSLSSLERVELLSELENKYQVELDEDSFAKLKSTRELEEWLRRPEIAEPEAPLSEWARSLPVDWLRTAFQHAVAMPLYRHTSLSPSLGWTL